jgi:hypothetical protein
MGSASLSALESIHDKDRWKTVGQDAFFLLTTVNHISVHPEIVDFGSGQGRENAVLGQKMPFLDGHELLR